MCQSPCVLAVLLLCLSAIATPATGQNVAGQNVAGQNVGGQDVAGQDVGRQDVGRQDVGGQDVATAPLPSGLEVVRRSAELAGGVVAFEKVKTVVMKGTFSILKADVTGSVVTQYSAPDRARITVDLGQFGKTVQRINGKAGWESSPNAGQRTLDAKETSRLLESISMRNAFEPEKVYEKIANKGLEDVDGKPCYRLELKRAGNDHVDQVFYGVESGLPMRTVVSRPTPAGVSVVDSQVSDYKEFDGIKLATKVVQHLEAFDITYEVRIESVVINVALADSLFTQEEE